VRKEMRREAELRYAALRQAGAAAAAPGA
jgi:hypothetical protein